jgi:hypothetical protein
MGMQRQLWSLNALSNELGMDRRTLAKRLQSLPPLETKEYDKRTEKLWHMADVVEHLQRQKTKPGDKQKPVNGFRMIHEEGIKHLLWWLGDEMAPACGGLFHADYGLEPDKARLLYANIYTLMVHYTEQYLCGDVFNKQFKESGGQTFDQLFALAHGEAVLSMPPKAGELEIKLPSVIEEMVKAMQ